MNREAWRQRTDPEIVNRRAAGRRKYNQRRQRERAARRTAMRQMIHALGYEVWTIEALAERFNVSKATVCRDLAAMNIDLARLRRRYEATPRRLPTADDVQQSTLDMALVLGGYAARLSAALATPGQNVLTPEQSAAVAEAYERTMARGTEALAYLRARFGLDD